MCCNVYEQNADVLKCKSMCLYRLVQVLDYAEDDLMCSHVVVCFKRNRTDRSECNAQWCPIYALVVVTVVYCVCL